MYLRRNALKTAFSRVLRGAKKPLKKHCIERVMCMDETNAVRQRRWKKRNRETVAARNAEYWNTHKDEVNARRRERYAQRKKEKGGD